MIDTTRVWIINKSLVIGDTIEEAISTYKEEYKDSEVNSVDSVYDKHTVSSTTALIKRE